MGLMMLAAGMGSRIRIVASGPGAEEAVLALRQLVERKFDEE
jgi:phosphocarrier protein